MGDLRPHRRTLPIGARELRDIIEQALLTLDLDADGRRGQASFAFDEAQAFFEGHFPGNPMVPGVFLIEVARILAERIADQPLDLVEIIDARFTAQIGPDDTVMATVTLTSPSGSSELLRCTATLATPDHSAGRVRLDLKPHTPA